MFVKQPLALPGPAKNIDGGKNTITGLILSDYFIMSYESLHHAKSCGQQDQLLSKFLNVSYEKILCIVV